MAYHHLKGGRQNDSSGLPYMDRNTFNRYARTAQQSEGAARITDPSQVPVIPLPNPGEGGPVYPGNDYDPGQEPVIPLPNPGEGAPSIPATTTTRARSP